LDAKNQLNWHGFLNYPNNCEDNWKADTESDIGLYNRIQDSATPEQQNVSATPNVPELIQPTPRSQKNLWKVLMTFNTIEMRSNRRIKKK